MFLRQIILDLYQVILMQLILNFFQTSGKSHISEVDFLQIEASKFEANCLNELGEPWCERVVKVVVRKVHTFNLLVQRHTCEQVNGPLAAQLVS